MTLRKLTFRTSLIALTALSLSAALTAEAQWIWKDEKKQTVVSDQPPPKSIPLKDIIQTPRGASLSPRVIKLSSDTATTDEKKDDGPKTLADKDLDYKKRQKEAAEAGQKQAEDAARAKAQQDRCKTLRENIAGLQSGMRIARTNEKGDREYLDDAQRQAEVKKSQTGMQGC